MYTMFYIHNRLIPTIAILLLNLNIFFAKELRHNQFVNNNNHTYSNLMARVLMNVFENCFSHKPDIITVAGDCESFENWHQNFSPKMVIYRVGLSEWKAFERHRRLRNVFSLTERVVSKLYYPSELFIVFSTSPSVLKKLLERMKKSVTWKSSAIYFFVNEEFKRCDEVDGIFREAWIMNIYNAAYVCLDESGNIQFFSFNPFKNASSSPWRFSHFTIGLNNNISRSMSVFKFAHNTATEKPPLCPNPEFDKTHDLDNYPITLQAVTTHFLFDVKKPAMRKAPKSLLLSDYEGPEAILSQILWSHLRARPVLNLSDDLGYVTKNNTLTGSIRSLMKNKFDMTPNSQYISDFWRLQTFPHEIQGVCVITLARNRQSPPFGVILFDFHILWRVLVLGSAAAIALVYAVKMKPGKVYLEILKSLLNMTSKFQPGKSCFKRLVYIYVSFTFFFFNMQLNSSITSDRYNFTIDKTPQSFEGFYNAGYILMGPGIYTEFLDEHHATSHYIVSKVSHCYKSLVDTNVTLACTSNCKVNQNSKFSSKLVSSKPIRETFVTYLVREDWPLLSTVNKVIHKLVQAGILLFLDSTQSNNWTSRQEIPSTTLHNHLPQPIALDGVKFIYYFLTAGQLLAFLIFLLEFCWNKLYTRKAINKNLDNLLILRYTKPRKSRANKILRR